MAEYWYSTTYNSSIHIMPFKVVYGVVPPMHIPYIPGDFEATVVDQLLKDREITL